MSHLRRRAIAIACLGLLCGPMLGLARAADAPAPIQGSSGPAAASAPPQPAPLLVESCDKPSSPRAADHGPISVSVNAATAWQPRGGEVLIAVEGDPIKFTGLNFRACFGWSNIQAKDYFSAENLGKIAWYEGFVMVRPSEQTGVINLGVIVPPLPSAPNGLFDRWFSTVRSTGLGLVPVVDMRLIAYTKDAVLFDEVRPIGVTNVPFAVLVAAATLVIAVGVLYRLAAGPRSGTRHAWTQSWLKAAVSPTWILTLVQTPDGRASLSAFQLLLWTLIVAASAAYVMALSGNLINITSGTLTLLGIAGAAGLIAAFTDSPSASARQDSAAGATGAEATATGAAAAGATGAAPQWRNLVLDPITGAPNISRIQMLFFTVVSAAFVVVQVLNYYVIPDIPAGYQILIGISNGVYVGSKIRPRTPGSGV